MKKLHVLLLVGLLLGLSSISFASGEGLSAAQVVVQGNSVLEVPEPGTSIFLGGLLLGLGVFGRRRFLKR